MADFVGLALINRPNPCFSEPWRYILDFVNDTECCLLKVDLHITVYVFSLCVSGFNGTGARIQLLPLNSGMSKNCLLVRKCSSKNAKFGAETPHFGEI